MMHPVPKMIRLPISEIVLLADVNIRELDTEYVDELMEAQSEYGESQWQTHWKEKPKVNQDRMLFSGFHTITAAKRNFGTDHEVSFQVVAGNPYLLAACENAVHGKRRTNADKRASVLRWLQDDEGRQWADSHIAKQCHVSNVLVMDVDTSLKKTKSNTYDRPTKRKYIDKHGNVAWMETAKINGRPGASQAVISGEKPETSEGLAARDAAKLPLIAAKQLVLNTEPVASDGRGSVRKVSDQNVSPLPTDERIGTGSPVREETVVSMWGKVQAAISAWKSERKGIGVGHASKAMFLSATKKFWDLPVETETDVALLTKLHALLVNGEAYTFEKYIKDQVKGISLWTEKREKRPLQETFDEMEAEGAESAYFAARAAIEKVVRDMEIDVDTFYAAARVRFSLENSRIFDPIDEIRSGVKDAILYQHWCDILEKLRTYVEKRIGWVAALMPERAVSIVSIGISNKTSDAYERVAFTDADSSDEIRCELSELPAYLREALFAIAVEKIQAAQNSGKPEN